MTDVLLGIIPATVVDAFAKGDILQVLLFSILFGFALHGLGEAGRALFRFIDGLSRVLFAVVGIIMKTAPIGAFGAMAFTVGNFGVGTLAQLGLLMACFYATCVLFVAVVLNGIARLHGFSVWRFIKYIKEELFIVYGTSSSESALPRLMAKLENLGVRRSVVGLVIPAGYSFNLDGTAIYLTIAAVFIAQATNTPLDLRHQLTLLAVLLVTSKGSAGVAGAALIVLAGTISASGVIPVAGVALVPHPSVHGRGDGGDESDWQRRRHDRGGEVVQPGGRATPEGGPPARDGHRGGGTGDAGERAMNCPVSYVVSRLPPSPRLRRTAVALAEAGQAAQSRSCLKPDTTDE